MSKAVVLPCSCDHKYQDEKYGHGNRVHNESAGTKGVVSKCTVCGAKR